MGHRGRRSAGQGSGRVRDRLSRVGSVVRAARIYRGLVGDPQQAAETGRRSAPVIVLLALAAAAAVQPQTALTVAPTHRLVEGIASDGKTIWVSSILDRQVLACRTTCRTLATLPAPLHPFAIAWDGTRKRLWIAADCPPGVTGITPCERGALIALDTRGRIQTRIAPEAGTFHPGDVSVSHGRVFVSDSQNGLVFGL